MSSLKDAEFDERVAILRRLRKLLAAQRDKFREYLRVLDRQEQDIIRRDVEKLEAHVELEQSIVRDIFAFQKAIDPLTDMYRMAYPLQLHEEEIPVLRESLSHLKEGVLERNRRNQDLLRRHMGELRREIRDIRSRTLPKSYSGRPEPCLIDITT